MSPKSTGRSRARRGVLRGPPESQMAGKPRNPAGGHKMAVKWVRINETWYYAHTLRATSQIKSSLRRSSSTDSALPRMEVAKPLCGLSARRSWGTKRLAS